MESNSPPTGLSGLVANYVCGNILLSKMTDMWICRVLWLAYEVNCWMLFSWKRMDTANQWQSQGGDLGVPDPPKDLDMFSD
ncbi:hypothetical protein TNCV_4500331 [Trichonephila clavipes]|nr:hypothetical protein TNCV_4500331 [Trichonephila clavipes]